jgi:hypothetical protein
LCFTVLAVCIGFQSSFFVESISKFCHTENSVALIGLLFCRTAQMVKER